MKNKETQAEKEKRHHTSKLKRRCIYCNRMINIEGKTRHKHAFRAGEKCEYYERKKKGLLDGTPTTYNIKILEKTDKYINSTLADSKEEYHKVRGARTNTYERILVVNMPSISGLLLYLGIGSATLYKWKKGFPEFKKRLELIKRMRKKRLMDGGLSGQYNATIVKLLLNSEHNVVERNEISGKDGRELVIKIVKYQNTTEKTKNGLSPAVY